MPGFEDSALIVLLALLLFGPKKLPELARQFGKLMSDFRRASSEFRTQMEDELRISEQADRQKQITATTTPTPAVVPTIDSAQTGEARAEYAGQDPPLPESSLDSALESVPESTPHTPPDDPSIYDEYPPDLTPEYMADTASGPTPVPYLESTAHTMSEAAPATQLIATAGELSIKPPSTGLPTPHTAAAASESLPLPFGEPADSAVPAEHDAHETEAVHG